MVKINMLKWAKDLFPICRSITGSGTRRTLNYFKRINPEFKTIKFSSGKKVFDWVIPLEWNIKDAFFKHENGKKFAEFKKNNLHVVGYSVPIKKTELLLILANPPTIALSSAYFLSPCKKTMSV